MQVAVTSDGLTGTGRFSQEADSYRGSSFIKEWENTSRTLRLAAYTALSSALREAFLRDNFFTSGLIVLD